MWLPGLWRATALSSSKHIVFPYINNALLRSPLLWASAEQIRGRKRALKKPLSKQERLERRLKREEKEAKRKQYTFMQRIENRRLAQMLSPSEQFPGRYNAEAEAKLEEPSGSSVIIRDQCRTQFYSIAKALSLHRQLQQPAMYNHPDGKIQLRIELNMSTEKATKMIPDTEEIVPVPFPFEHQEKRTILAMAASKANQEIAIEAGAEIAVGPESVKKILKGEFIITDFDFCVAHTDMGGSILPLRGLMRSRFPTISNGALGKDLPQIIQRFITGVRLSIKADPIYPHWGLARPIVGRLGMADEEIEANIAAIVEALCKHRSPALGPFINRTTISVVPDRMCFAIDVSKYEPVATDSDIEKLESRKKKKKSKKVQKVELAEDDDSYLLGLM